MVEPHLALGVPSPSPGLLPCRSSHQPLDPVPPLPGGFSPSTAVSSPGSEQLLEAHPPTFSPGKGEASIYKGLAEQGVPFQVALVIKNLPFNAGDIKDAGLIPGSVRFPGGGHGNPL